MTTVEGAPAEARARPVQAALFMLGCSALMAAASLIAKALGRGVGGEALSPLQISAGRFLVAFLAVSAVAAFTRPGFQGTAWGTHFARSTAGWGGVTCLFAAAALMPLAEATAISFLSPIATMLLAIPFLGERVGPWRFAGAAVSLLGALLLIRPGSEAFQPAALIALGSALLMGMEAVLIKRLSGREPVLRILFVNNGFGTVISVSAAAFVWVQPSGTQVAMLVAIGLSVVSAQVCFLNAMRRADASYAIPFFYTTLLFAALYDVALFGEAPDLLAALGAAIVISGALLIAWRERLQRERSAR